MPAHRSHSPLNTLPAAPDSPAPARNTRSRFSTWHWGKPTLLVVDYAEARTNLEALLEELADHDGDPVIRVLLLARTLGGWWQLDGPLRRHAAIRDVLAGAEAVELGPLTGIPLRHQETFDAALEPFANYYGVSVPVTMLRPVPKNTPVLLLHIAALTAVLDVHEGRGTAASVAATGDVVAELLGHEVNYWSQTAAAHGLNQLGVRPSTRRQVVAIAGLLGADDEQEARQVLRRLPVLADASALIVENILDWMRELYPATGSSWFGPIQPDLLLEYLVTSIFSTSAELADTALTGLDEHRASHALPVLTRAYDHYPASAYPLLPQLLMGNADVLAITAVHLARNLDNAAFSQVLADIIADAQITHEVLTTLAADMRQVPVSLVAVYVAVHLRVGVGEVAAGQLSNAKATTGTLISAAHELVRSGFHGAAVPMYRAAVMLCRALDEAEPDRHRADLAFALIALGATLHNLGQYQDAYPVQAEAVELYRALDEAEPGRYRTEQAYALSNLGGNLSHLGQYRDAYPVQVEAVELCRALDEAEPGRYRAERARALSKLGETMRRIGHYRDAYPVQAEAVELYRALDKAEPGRYRTDLAGALTNLGALLGGLGQYQDMYPVQAGAVELYRALDKAEPGRYRTELATALTNLSTTASSLGQYRDAYPVQAEAVELYRTADEAEPGRHRTELATALTNLGALLGGLGQYRDAYPVQAEAVELYRALDKAEPGRYRTDLATALTNLSNTLRKLDRPEEALSITAEVVGFHRALMDIDHAVYQGGLADALTVRSGILLDLGRLEEAEGVRREADIYGHAS